MMNMDQIRTMTLPQRVRARPAVLFGEFGAKGVLNAVKLLLEVFEAEAALGHCDRLHVELRDANEVLLHCNDRGLCLDDTPVDGAPAWEHAFCRLYPGPRKEDEPYRLQLGATHNLLYGDRDTGSPTLSVCADHRVNLCCVQCASLWFRVESVKERVKRTVDFEKGYHKSGPTCEPVDEENGTLLRFCPDPEVFGVCDLSFEALKECLDSADLRGLHCTAADARTSTNQ